MVAVEPGATPAGGVAAVICGIGYRLPDRVVTNAEICARLDTTEEWISSRIGVSTRRVVEPGESTSDLAVQAAARALKSYGRSEVDALVLATTTPDRPCPATAPEVASRLGLAGIPAFDVAAVCTGFLYGLATATGLIASGIAEHVLVVAADAFSTIVDPADRATAPIFGDGAGAVVVRRGSSSEPGAIGPISLGSDGTLSDLISVEAGGSRQPVPDGPESRYFQMQGRAVFRHAVERMTEAARSAADSAGWTLDQVDRLVTHQANARISAAVAADLGIAADRVAQNIREVGNTAAASIPILLAQAMADGHLTPGHRVLLAAFGGGLTWGATTVVWPELHNPE